MRMLAGQVVEELVAAGKGMEQELVPTVTDRAEPAAQKGVVRAAENRAMVHAHRNLIRKVASRPNLPRAKGMSTDLADQTD